MHGVEELGLLKMDFLGLRNLDVITDTVAMVRVVKDPEFDIDSVPLDDQAVFDLLGRGDTMGVFQLESPPMRALLRSLAPTSFDDVSAVLALYRPGPMSVNMHYDYADRKNGRQEVSYFHEDAEEVLGDTYGLMIYQESVMRVAQKFAGYSLAEADNLRKAMGKKSPRGHGRSPSRVRGRRRTVRLRPGARQAAVRRHREVRGLRVQQEPHLRVRARHLPDGVSQGALPGRVLRLPAVEREEQPRQGGRLPLGRAQCRHQGADTRHQPFGHRLRDGHSRGDRGSGHSARRLAGGHHVRAVGNPQRR